jgi:DNA replication protein DnaC
MGLRAIPRASDPDNPPKPYECEHCGKVGDWRWVDMRKKRPNSPSAKIIGALWVRRWSRCPRCARSRERDEEAKAHAGRQTMAQVPKRLRKASFDRLIHQTPGELDRDFIDRVRLQKHGIGATTRCGKAWATAMDWTPDSGHSMLLHGPTGSGKSLMLACVVNRMLAPARLEVVGENDWGRPVFGGGVGYSARFVAEPELLDRHSIRWRGDPEPLLKVSRTPALALDDLGSDIVEGTKTLSSDIYQKVIRRLVADRYDHGLHFVVSTNMDLETIEDVFGARMAERLMEMCRGHVYEVDGINWRKLDGGITVDDPHRGDGWLSASGPLEM